MDQDIPATESAAANAAEPPAYSHLWQVVRRRKMRLALGAVVGLALAFAYHALSGPWYESNAQIQVIKKPLQTAPISGPELAQPPEEYLSTHLLIITSPEVVGDAVRKKNLGSLGCFQKKEGLARDIKRSIYALSRYIVGPGRQRKPEDVLIKDIIDQLVATRDSPKPGINPSNEVLILTFRGTVPEDCDAVVKAIIASYQDFLKTAYQDINAQTLKAVMEARDVLTKDLKVAEEDYENFLHDSDVVYRNREGTTVLQQRLFNLDMERLPLRTRQEQIKASKTGIEHALKKGGPHQAFLETIGGFPANRETANPALLPKKESSTSGRSPPPTLEELFSLWFEEQTLAKDRGSENSAVQTVRKRRQFIGALFMPSSALAAEDPEQSAWLRDFVNLKIQLLEQELDQIERIDKSLGTLFKIDEKKAQVAQLDANKAERLRNAIEARKLLFENIVKRLQEIQSVREYGGYETRLIGPPECEFATKKYLLLLGLALFTGLLGGLGWAYRAELSDKSFRTPQEIRRRLGLAVVGHIPLLSPSKEMAHQAEFSGLALDPLLCTYYRPNSREAEAYRSVRTFLYFGNGAGGHRMVQITSPTQGDGKTILAANLAVSLAQAGKKVLLLDADLRRPNLHHVFASPNRIGLTTLLAGQGDLAEAIQHTAIPGLALLPSGPLPSNPAELLSLPRLGELLQAVREQFEFVLIDSSPLLAVTDPSVVAPHVDGVLLAVRLSRKARPQAERAKETLDSLGAKVLGVVVNGVGQRSGSRSYRYDHPELALYGVGGK